MSAMHWSSIEILVVEDSQTQRMLLQETLEKLGAKVTTANDGKEGLDRLNEHQPDIIITDIEMPEMDGYSLCQAIKDNQNTSHIPVILLTNLSDPMDVIKGIDCGADNFLTKPCSETLLLSSIEDAIENSKIERNFERNPLLEFSYRGKRHKIKVNQCQITDLLLSTYSSAIEKNSELEKTNRKLSLLHLEFQKKNKELTKLVNEKNLFLGMAAHDLRNPLNAIQAYSHILSSKLSDISDDKIPRMLKTINQSSQFMLQIVNDLLDLSVIDLGKLTLTPVKQNLQELVGNNCKLNQCLADQKDIEIHFTDNSDNSEIICDPSKIEQVLNNLLSNAIKFSNPGSKVEVTLANKDNGVQISIKDHGVGIPEDEKDLLFKSFGKTSVKSTAGEPSTGLGLAIARKIVHEHQGDITVDSQLGKGTTFTVSLRKFRTPEEFQISHSKMMSEQTSSEFVGIETDEEIEVET